jgi:ADP-ribose pyrophosphatase YjhB (NUDIX family)
MEQVIVNVEVVVVRDGAYLLGVRSEAEEYGAGWLTLPGGKLEVHAELQRALEVTAQRELKEEVDLDVALDDLHYVESHIFFIDDMPVLDVVMVTTNA